MMIIWSAAVTLEATQRLYPVSGGTELFSNYTFREDAVGKENGGRVVFYDHDQI